jgi:hypothetical protein
MSTPLVKPVKGNWRATRLRALARLARPRARARAWLGLARLVRPLRCDAMRCDEEVVECDYSKT